MGGGTRNGCLEPCFRRKSPTGPLAQPPAKLRQSPSARYDAYCGVQAGLVQTVLPDGQPFELTR
jgi:hypothetical protein